MYFQQQPCHRWVHRRAAAHRRPLDRTSRMHNPKHFFSGAALYANGKICAFLSPAGFAVKLPADLRQSLIKERKGTEFRFFAKGPIKREYVALSDSIVQDEEMLEKLINLSARYAVGALSSNSLDEE